MTAISSNRADKKAEKLLEREIARKKRKLQKTTAFDVFNIIFLLILAFIVIVPFYYTIVRSFLTQQEFIMNGTTLWPQSPTIGNYRDIFVGTGLLRSFFNSVLYTVTGTLFSMFLATTLAYGLSKKNYPGRALFQNMIVFTMYFGGGVAAWFDKIDASGGAAFFASGVFYYFLTQQVRELVQGMADAFPGGVLVFDAANRTAVKMIAKTWLRTAKIKDVGAYFAVSDAKSELSPWDSRLQVSSRGYMLGYNDLKDPSVSGFFRFLARVGDNGMKMQIVKIGFGDRQ